MDIRHEVVLRALGWGTVVYFLITGFALGRHALFELKAQPGLAQLQRAQTAHADALDAMGRTLARSDQAQAADLAAQAAKIRFEVAAAAKERSDSRYRAIGLITGALVFAVLYPLLILAAYRRTDSGDVASPDLVPLKAALAYGIGTSVVTATARRHHRLPMTLSAVGEASISSTGLPPARSPRRCRRLFVA